MRTNQFAIKTLVSDEIFTDRQYFLDLFYNEALKATTRRSSSMVLLGQRRMGKTEIFKRVVNRLFFEQDHKDPNAVVPVYYKFPDNITDRWELSKFIYHQQKLLCSNCSQISIVSQMFSNYHF